MRTLDMSPSLPSAIVSAGAPAVFETIQSRFGEVTVDVNKAVVFSQGLLGMPGKTRFSIASFPNEKMQQFTLLQSLDEKALSFITLPITMENPFVAIKDIQEVSRSLKIDDDSLALLLIVSVHRQPGQVRLSVNARAPLFIDVVQKTGVQHVFQNESYQVQQML